MDEWGTAGFKRPGQNFKNSISSGVGSRKSISGRRQETGIQSAVRFPHHAQDRVDFEWLLCFGFYTTWKKTKVNLLYKSRNFDLEPYTLHMEPGLKKQVLSDLFT